MTLTYGVTNVATASATSGTVRLLAPNTYLGDTVLGGPNTTYEIAANTPFGVGGTVNVNSFNTAPRFASSTAPHYRQSHDLAKRVHDHRRQHL